MQPTITTAVEQPATATTTNISEQNKKITTTYFFRDIACKINIDGKYKAFLCSNTNKDPHIVNVPMQCSAGHLSCYQCAVVVSQPMGQEKKACPKCYLSNSPSTNNISEEGFILNNDLCIGRSVNSIPINCPSKETFNLEGEQQCDWHGELKQLESHLITNCKIFPKVEVLQRKISLLEKQFNEAIASIPTKDSLIDTIKSQEEDITHLREQSLEQNRAILRLDDQIAHIMKRLEETKNVSSPPIIWTIDNFHAQLQNAKQKVKTSIISPSFYSSPKRYKFATKVYLNGDGTGEGTHMSVFIMVKKGEYDDELAWPLANAKISFTLINQDGKDDVFDSWYNDPTSSNFQKPKADSNIATGAPRFILHDQLLSGGFIKNNKIVLKTEVKIAE
jgi:uncharacterized coiled-coil protein SlyX